MKLLALSDLHIEGPEDPFYADVLAWIEAHAVPGDALVLAGDIFDLYVGDKSFFAERFHAFRDLVAAKARSGVAVHYIEGNHDFRLERSFGSLPGVTLHESQCVVRVGGRKVFIAHGDLVDREDRGYLALRAFLRSLPMRLFIDRAPDSWIDAIGTRMSGGSHRLQTHRRRDSEREAARQERTRTLYRSFAAEKVAEGYDFVILGHCHLIDEFRIRVGGREGQYMNMGFPKRHGSGIVLGETELELTRLRIGQPAVGVTADARSP